MARARPIPDLDPDGPFAAAAAKVVAVRTAELGEHSHGVLDVTDIDRVHDLRVATRRLRAVLEVFRPCFPKSEYKTAVAELKTMADALGERRDRDVLIEALTAFHDELEDGDRAGVAAMIAAIEAERPAANATIAPLVSDAHLAHLDALLRGLVTAAEAESAGGP